MSMLASFHSLDLVKLWQVRENLVFINQLNTDSCICVQCVSMNTFLVSIVVYNPILSRQQGR